MNDSQLEIFMRESNAIEGEYLSCLADTTRVSNWRVNIGNLYQNDIQAAKEFLAQPISEKSLLECHYLLASCRDDLDLQRPGRYRDCFLDSPPKALRPGLVEHVMHNFFLDLHQMTPWEAHCRYEKIHPFEDLNGRTGRLLWLHKTIKDGDEDLVIKYGFTHLFYYQTLTKFKL